MTIKAPNQHLLFDVIRFMFTTDPKVTQKEEY